MRLELLSVLLLTCSVAAQSASAMSIETRNSCSETTNDPCIRSGDCSVQGTDWSQVVTVDRLDLYDTMGWPGVCDQVHVALVQGNCSPGGVRVNVTASLQANSSASIPELVGPLACGAEPPIPVSAGSVVGRVVLAVLFATFAVASPRRAIRME